MCISMYKCMCKWMCICMYKWMRGKEKLRKSAREGVVEKVDWPFHDIIIPSNCWDWIERVD